MCQPYIAVLLHSLMKKLQETIFFSGRQKLLSAIYETGQKGDGRLLI